MVHQHFRLVGSFTGRENLRLAARGLPWETVDAKSAQLMREVGLDAPLDTPVAGLSVAEQQRIEILKALVLGARILVLDEPTAVLTDAEADRLLALMQDLAGAGHAIVFITHKLREVMRAGDRVSVLRRGKMVLEGCAVAGMDRGTLSLAMIGESVATPERAAAKPGEIRLELRGLSVWRGGLEAVRKVDLTVRAGEILGLAGVGGNGQRELAEAVLGLCPSDGQVWLDNQPLTNAGTAERRRRGMRYIPADRRQDGLSLNSSIADNLMAAAVRRGDLGRWMLNPARLSSGADTLIDQFSIAGAAAGGRRPVRLLSGGNAQKVVLARELDNGARLIVAHSPTQGLDVAAQAFVHSELLRVASEGAAVLMISEDLEEILTLSDRIEVISRGQVHAGPTPRPSRTEIGEMMLGHA
jgi:simple sugar transport system ATP-binding protein